MKKFALSRLNTAMMRGFCVSSVAASIALAPQALAQESADEEEAAVERVMVTGSRISRDPNLAAPSPVQAIDAKDIRSSGEFSIADVVNDIPALFNSTTSEQGTDGDAAFQEGSNILDLRGLGARRTLTLVNGKRHVGGSGGSSAVDVGSIPTRLIDSVEVMTGGASAIYGADAVTGVVNFILKDDFEGFEFDIQQGVSGENDAQQTQLSATYGLNFDDEKGNIAISVEWADSKGLQANERDNGLVVGSARDWVNPALRFQQGDITSATPNFAQFYNPNRSLPTFGISIPTAENFIEDYMAAFGVAPDLTQAELALISRGATAPDRAILPGRTFPFTSGYGYIVPGNAFTFTGFDENTPIDLNGNGTPDCLDSFTGWNSSFAPGAFGALGGCWVTDADGTYRPIQDGLIASGGQGFGGDSFNAIRQDNTYLITPEKKVNVNVIGNYDVTDSDRLTWELKYTAQEVQNTTQPDSFWDLLYGAPDNPFLPEFIQPVAQQTGGVGITIDPIGLGPGIQTHDRTTTRAVIGLDGEFDNGWTYDISYVWGKFKRETETQNEVINDRFLAAIDAVTDPSTGQATCRSSVDPTTPAQTTPFNIPDYDPGYFSFTPGDGTCVPLNIWAGQVGITQAAIDWVTTTTNLEIEIEQRVFNASVAGDFDEWFELPAGSVIFAIGTEYREEESQTTFDDFMLGNLPTGNPFGEGVNIADVSDNTKLTFRPKISNANETGEYDVTEFFAEVAIPLLEGKPFAEELLIDGAYRYSDYSTIGSSSTWKTNLQWAPYEDLVFRFSVSQAVRAPNITELFGPEIGQTFRPADPCDVAQIESLRSGGLAQLADSTQANCVTYFQGIGLDPFDADGNYSFVDPLSASFGGITGGNSELGEETADTTTIGFVFRPSFLEGFNMTVDYWSIEIEDAISEVTDEDIARGCYEGPSLNNSFCDLLGRNSDPNSIFFGGFNFMRSTSINFAKLETDGYDFALNYDFTWNEHEIGLSLSGTKVDALDQFINPLDLSQVDVELGEIRRPEWAGNFNLNWTAGDLTIGWQTQYQGEQLLNFVEIDTAQARYGDAVFMDEVFIHDINFNYQATENIMLYGGINNVSEEEPFITSRSLPVSARGRYFFMGVNFRL